jgi:hypothetical protein
MRVNTILVSAGQMKRLINNNKRYVLMVVREKDVGTSDAFQECDPSHKKELIDVVFKYDDIFQEPDGLPTKRKSKMRYIFNKILLFLTWACIGCQL